MKRKWWIYLSFILCCGLGACSKDANLGPERGEVIQFGKTVDEGSESISWVVLECEDGKALLLSEEVVAYCEFHKKTNTGIEWHESDVCTWLNTEFYEEVFATEEKEKILSTKVQTKKYGSNSADSVENKVFLLDTREVQEYVSDTEYARVDTEESVSGWLLRDKGQNQSYIVYVDKEGNIINSGTEMNKKQGIRPAIWISVE